MGDVVNLRRARRRKAHRDAEAIAAENRARHGQTRHEKTLRKAEDAQAARRLDGHRLTAPGDDDDAHKPDA